MVKITKNNWYWHHNVSECYYHIQITIKYSKALFDSILEDVILDVLLGLKERYSIDVDNVGFGRDHIHILCRFLAKYSGGQVIRLIKSITSQKLFSELPRLKEELWGGEFWTDGYYISTISGRGDKKIIEKYIENQGRVDDVKQLKLFNL